MPSPPAYACVDVRVCARVCMCVCVCLQRRWLWAAGRRRPAAWLPCGSASDPLPLFPKLGFRAGGWEGAGI